MRRPGRCVSMIATALLKDINSLYSYEFFLRLQHLLLLQGKGLPDFSRLSGGQYPRKSSASSCWSPLLAWQTCEKRLQICLAALLWPSRCHVWLHQHLCGMQQDSAWMQLLILCRPLGNVPQQTENVPVYLTGVKPNEIKYNGAIGAHSVCCIHWEMLTPIL